MQEMGGVQGERRPRAQGPGNMSGTEMEQKGTEIKERGKTMDQGGNVVQGLLNYIQVKGLYL